MDENTINQFAHCETYNKGSEGYKTLDEMTDIQIGQLNEELSKLGYALSYNLIDDCYTIY